MDAHSSNAAAPRVVGRPFTKGQSGNPSGRARGIEARAREYTEEALQALVAALHNPRERVSAAIALLDRGWGKPQVNIKSEHDVNMLHLLAAQAISAELLTAAAC